MGPLRTLAHSTIAVAVFAAGWGIPAADDEILIAESLIEIVDIERRALTISHGEGKPQISFDVPRGTPIALDGDSGAILEDLFSGDTIESGILRNARSGRLYAVELVVRSDY